MKDNILNTKKFGYKFYFQDGDNQIACFGSYFTGKEDIYINDDLVSSKRSMGLTSMHQFEFAQMNYQIKYDMINMLTGKLECTFLKNNKRIEQQEQTAISLIKDPKKALLFLGGCFGGGFLVGLVAYIFVSAIFEG